MPRLFIIVPVLNEAPNLPRLMTSFAQLKAELSETFTLQFILVDDGSTDQTADIAKTLSDGIDLRIVKHSINRGPGAAFATAFSTLVDQIQDDDWVATMEGDNTSRHELLQQMLLRAKEGFDVILASPYMYGGGITKTSLLRKILSGGANLIVKDLLGIQGILTVSSFYRLYSARGIRRLQNAFGPGIIERTGFESMVEMVMKMVMLHLKISEVAMELDSSRRLGKSKMKIMKTIGGYLALLINKNRWLSLSTHTQTVPTT